MSNKIDSPPNDQFMLIPNKKGLRKTHSTNGKDRQ